MKDGAKIILPALVAKLEAGRPLHAALTELAATQTVPALRQVIEQLAERIRQGSNLSSALAQHPTVFDPAYIGLLRVFEDAAAAASSYQRNGQK